MPDVRGASASRSQQADNISPAPDSEGTDPQAPILYSIYQDGWQAAHISLSFPWLCASACQGAYILAYACYAACQQALS